MGEDGNVGDATTPWPGRRDKPKDDACNGEPDAKRIRALPPCNVCGGKVEAETLARCLPQGDPIRLRRWCGEIVHAGMRKLGNARHVDVRMPFSTSEAAILSARYVET